MDLDWQLDNPAIALKKYYEDFDSFVAKKSTNEIREEELNSKEIELSEKKSELEEKKTKLQGIGECVEGDINSQITLVQREIQGKIDGAQMDFNKKKEKLNAQKQKSISENDVWLSERIKKLIDDNEDANRELTEAERKALEFEIERRQFVVASNERINGYEDAITQENLDCQTIVGELKQNQDSIFAKFEPDISKYKKVIESIDRKHQPDIRQAQNIVYEKVAARDEEIGQLQMERDREVQLANNEIFGYQRDYKQTEKSYNEQIRMAKLQNKPTTRMENSKVSRLNSINDQIQKVNYRANKKLSGIDQKIEVASGKHSKQISKAEEQLNAIIRKRDQELSSPTNTYNGLINDRDGQIATIQSKIDQRERERKNRVDQLNSSISNERQAQNQHNSEVDQKIVAFVMSGETCFPDVLNEANEPFIALQERINTWMELLSTIKKDKMSTAYPAVHEAQKNELSAKNYSELQNELSEAQQFNDSLSAFSKNNKTFTIVGGVLAGIGIVLFVVLYCVLKNSIGFVGFLAAGIGVGAVVLTFVKTKKEFALICKYVSLASDYQKFSEISSHSTQVTQECELANMKNIGNKLYYVHYGKTEAQNIHDAKDADIKANFERNLKLITVEFKNAQAQFERERDGAIEKIKNDASDGEERFNSKKEEVQSEIQNLTIRIGAIDERIREIKDEIDQNNKFLDAFESNYKILEKNLGDGKWMAPMDYTHGKLSDDLYIIPEKGVCDDYKHKRIYRINHNKKPLVITYDIIGIGSGDSSQVEETGKIIRDLMFDLMYSVYRMNSKETYAQFVVDEVGGTNDLKSTNVKNAFNIREVVGRLDDIKGQLRGFASQRERLAEKGTKIDDVNESKLKHQDRPEEYNILYIIYKPNERKSKLDDDIRTLIPECDKYGFLPVFICESYTWSNGIQEKESNYKDIKSLVNNAIVGFDGSKYSGVI